MLRRQRKKRRDMEEGEPHHQSVLKLVTQAGRMTFDWERYREWCGARNLLIFSCCFLFVDNDELRVSSGVCNVESVFGRGMILFGAVISMKQ
jgi:hypothetical protein